MKCQICQSDLVATTIGGVNVNRCSHGHGVLFEQGDLSAALDFLIKTENIPDEPIQALNTKAIGDLQISQDVLSCPVCNGQMKLVNYGYSSNIFIHDCADCKADWVKEEVIRKLATFLKGNTDMTKLGEAWAEEIKHDTEEEDAVENIGPGMMYPTISTTPILLGEDDKPDIIPVATIGIIAVNCMVFLYQSFFTDTTTFVKFWSYSNSASFSAFHVITLFSSLFVHENIIHLGSNMFYLWIIADEIEAKLTPVPFILFYLVLGVIATVFGAALFHYDFLVGASGAIAVLMGAFLCLYPKKRFKILYFNTIFHIPAYLFLGIWIVGNVILSSLLKDVEPVAYGVHICGFILGFVSMLIIQFLTPEKKNISQKSA